MKILHDPKLNTWQIRADSTEVIYTIVGKNNIYDVKAEWLKYMSRLFDDNVNNKFLY